MAYSNLQSRPRNIAFTAIACVAVFISLLGSVVANGLILQAEWARKYLPSFLARTIGNFDAVSRAALAMGAVLALLFCIGYVLSLDAFRRRRPTIRLSLLVVSLCAFPAIIILSYNSNDPLYWAAVAGGALLAPLIVFTAERIIGAALISLGRYARRREWWEFSAMLLRQGLRFFTASRLARRDYGMVLRSLGEVTLARGMLEPLFEEGYRDPEMLEALCDLAVTDEDWPQAAERLEALYAKRPGDKEVITQLAMAWVKTGHYDSALHLLQQIPDGKWSGQMLKLLRECACALGDLDGALEACEKLSAGKTYDKARAEYESLLSFFPGNPRIFYPLAALASERRQSADEAAWLERAVEAEPEDWSARRRLASLYRELSRPDLEIIHLEALATQPGQPDADSLLEYGAALGNKGSHEEAARLLETARRSFPGDGRFALSLARHYMSMTDATRALIEAQRAVDMAAQAGKQEEGQPAADASFLAEARAMLRRVEKAIAQKELEIMRGKAQAAPEDMRAQLTYIALLAENDEVDACVRELDKLVTNHPETKALAQQEALRFTQKTDRPFLIYSYLSDLALRDHEFDRALELYKAMSQRSLDPQEIIGEGCRRILTLQPEHLPAQRVLAEFHAARGDWQEVLSILTSYFDHGGERSEAVERIMFQAACQTADPEVAARWLERIFSYNPHDPQPISSCANCWTGTPTIPPTTWKWATFISTAANTCAPSGIINWPPRTRLLAIYPKPGRPFALRIAASSIWPKNRLQKSALIRPTRSNCARSRVCFTPSAPFTNRSSCVRRPSRLTSVFSALTPASATWPSSWRNSAGRQELALPM
ncbi:MAG: tetratricopeptide repeat protein [Candidatus Sumerlaeota bacterium]|nr:tetratricopeptide repeat protein [Candidatus Sumerlaeota bacterium]